MTITNKRLAAYAAAGLLAVAVVRETMASAVQKGVTKAAFAAAEPEIHLTQSIFDAAFDGEMIYRGDAS